jgi:hypothetical protein
MALIAEYRRSPQLDGRPVLGPEPDEASEPSGTSGDGELSGLGSDPGSDLSGELSQLSLPGALEDGATYASSSALAVLDPPRTRRRFGLRRGRPGGRGAGTGRDDAWPSARRRHEATLSLIGLVIGGIVLVAAGTGIGALLRQPAGRVTGGTRTGLADSLHRSGRGPGPPASPSPFPPRFKGIQNGLAMFQGSGDGYTTFVVHGSGWPPGAWVSIALVAPDGKSRPTAAPGRAGAFVDAAGTFNYAVDQDRALFTGLLPPGLYHVVVHGPDSVTRKTSFRVHVLPGPPGSLPPQPGDGSPPPSQPPS